MLLLTPQKYNFEISRLKLNENNIEHHKCKVSQIWVLSHLCTTITTLPKVLTILNIQTFREVGKIVIYLSIFS